MAQLVRVQLLYDLLVERAPRRSYWIAQSLFVLLMAVSLVVTINELRVDQQPAFVASGGAVAGLVVVVMLRQYARRRSRLFTDGRQATATVLAVDDGSHRGSYHTLRIRLLIREPDKQPDEVPAAAKVRPHHLEQIRPGADLPVRLAPAPWKAIAVDWAQLVA